MNRLKRIAILSIFALLAGFVPAGGIAQAETVSITEWEVPWDDSRPRDPFVDPKGRVWFCGQKGGYIAYLEPASGTFKKFDLGPGAGPHNLIVDAAGFIWFAGNRNAYIGKLDPDTGGITRFEMPHKEARDPHTLVFDGAGDIWFTVQRSNFIGKLFTQTGEVRLIKVPTRNALPYGIWMDSHNRPWVALFGSNKIASVNPETMELKEYELPRKDARPRRLAITSNGMIWYGDYAQGRLGRFDPQNGEFREWPLPGGDDSGPYAMTVDHEDRVWVVETGNMPNRLVGFDTSTKKFINITEIPERGGSVRHMVFDASEKTIWFGEDTNFIGRARIGKQE
ncbi:Vgb family protein [Nitrospina sp. 32_T5]|uniref:Vgb family protein n=1 Tax=unclassified Nitrospina TaxID=2638683 RepID=UPI003F949EBC